MVHQKDTLRHYLPIKVEDDDISGSTQNLSGSNTSFSSDGDDDSTSSCLGTTFQTYDELMYHQSTNKEATAAKSHRRRGALLATLYTLLVVFLGFPVLLIVRYRNGSVLRSASTSSKQDKSVVGLSSEHDCVKTGQVKSGNATMMLSDLLDTEGPILPNYYQQHQEELEKIFVKNYNDLSGGCQGPFQRVMTHARLLAWEHHPRNPSLVSTTWNGVVNCHGCLDQEPVFSLSSNDGGEDGPLESSLSVHSKKTLGEKTTGGVTATANDGLRGVFLEHLQVQVRLLLSPRRVDVVTSASRQRRALGSLPKCRRKLQDGEREGEKEGETTSDYDRESVYQSEVGGEEVTEVACDDR